LKRYSLGGPPHRDTVVDSHMSVDRTAATGRRAATRLIKRGVCLLLLNVLAGVAAIAWAGQRYGRYAPWETESALLTLPKNETVGVVLAGSSRAWVMSRYPDHHTILEETWGTSVVNMGMNAAGPLPIYLMLQAFYDRGNSADVLLYLVEPFGFFGAPFNEEHVLVRTEPFDARLLAHMLTSGVPLRRILVYGTSKFRWDWFAGPPKAQPWRRKALTAADAKDTQKIQNRLDAIYPEGTTRQAFNRNQRYFLDTIALAQAHGTRVVCVGSPSLLGAEPGSTELVDLLETCQQHMGIIYRDLSAAIQDPACYAHLDHLNADGIRVFATEVAPLVTKRRATAEPTAEVGK